MRSVNSLCLYIGLFDERSNSFHFREVSFPSAGESPKVSEDNPGRCTACHGHPARPIWDTLPTWPGVYGERYRAGLSKPESIGMQAFLARQAQDPRYRYLIGARRFGDRATYVASAATLYNGQNFEPPNARLSALLATLNVRSLVADLAAQPAFAPHRYVLLAAAAGNCGDLKSFFPASNATPVMWGRRCRSAIRRRSLPVCGRAATRTAACSTRFSIVWHLRPVQRGCLETSIRRPRSGAIWKITSCASPRRRRPRIPSTHSPR